MPPSDMWIKSPGLEATESYPAPTVLRFIFRRATAPPAMGDIADSLRQVAYPTDRKEALRNLVCSTRSDSSSH
jgi:hypothetical protein